MARQNLPFRVHRSAQGLRHADHDPARKCAPKAAKAADKAAKEAKRAADKAAEDAQRAADKAGSGQLITGTGAHRYEMIHDWLTAPEGLVWGDTQGLAQDSQGFIYVAHTVNSTSMRPEAIVVYDAQGKFVRAFGEDMRGGAHGLGK